MGTVKISLVEYRDLLKKAEHLAMVKRLLNSNTLFKEEFLDIVFGEDEEEKKIEVPTFMGGSVKIEDLADILNGNQVDLEGDEE